MSHFECRLNRRFWRSKKVVQVVQIVHVRTHPRQIILWSERTTLGAIFLQLPFRGRSTHVLQADLLRPFRSLETRLSNCSSAGQAVRSSS